MKIYINLLLTRFRADIVRPKNVFGIYIFGQFLKLFIFSKNSNPSKIQISEMSVTLCHMQWSNCSGFLNKIFYFCSHIAENAQYRRNFLAKTFGDIAPVTRAPVSNHATSVLKRDRD